MAQPLRKVAFSNPFYVLLIVASTLFTLTALAYLAGPHVLERAAEAGGREADSPSVALAGWLDRRGPTALGLEFAVMLVSGVLAMATDPWFTDKRREAPKPTRAGPAPR